MYYLSGTNRPLCSAQVSRGLKIGKFRTTCLHLAYFTLACCKGARYDLCLQHGRWKRPAWISWLTKRSTTLKCCWATRMPVSTHRGSCDYDISPILCCDPVFFFKSHLNSAFSHVQQLKRFSSTYFILFCRHEELKALLSISKFKSFGYTVGQWT